eukprot:scaffold266089_cov32-Tisochrysis_lutea.AAC.3
MPRPPAAAPAARNIESVAGWSLRRHASRTPPQATDFATIARGGARGCVARTGAVAQLWRSGAELRAVGIVDLLQKQELCAKGYYVRDTHNDKSHHASCRGEREAGHDRPDHFRT